MRAPTLITHLRAAAVGLSGLVGTAAVATASVHLVWTSVAGDSSVLRDALESVGRWVDDPAREGALALLGVAFLAATVLVCVAALSTARERRIKVARHGRAVTDVDRDSLARSIERALRRSVDAQARVSVSKRRRVNVALAGPRVDSVGDTAAEVAQAVEDWCGAHGAPCRAGRITVETHKTSARVDPPPAKRARELQ